MNRRSRLQWLIPLAGVIALAGVAIYTVAQSMSGSMGGHAMMGSNASSASASKANTESPGERAFHQNCSTCHGAPSPSEHTAAEWSAVVKNMEQRMSSYGLHVPDHKTTQAIVDYLQSHASK